MIDNYFAKHIKRFDLEHILLIMSKEEQNNLNNMLNKIYDEGYEDGVNADEEDREQIKEK